MSKAPKILTYDLNNKDDWYILTALRGPDDIRIYNLKYLTTSVIRYFAEASICNVASVYSPEDARSFWGNSEKTIVNALAYTKDNYHFVSHVQYAFTSLKIKFPKKAKEIETHLDFLDEIGFFDIIKEIEN